MEVPELIEAADATETGGIDEPELVVTESMAELFLKQGHPADALRIYRELLLRGVRAMPGSPIGWPSLEATEAAQSKPLPRYAASASGGTSVRELMRTVLGSRPEWHRALPARRRDGSDRVGCSGHADAPGGRSPDAQCHLRRGRGPTSADVAEAARRRPATRRTRWRVVRRVLRRRRQPAGIHATPGRRATGRRRRGRPRPVPRLAAEPQALIMRLAVLNGPNLNLLGQREPEIYGRTTLPEIEAMLRADARGAGRRARVAADQSRRRIHRCGPGAGRAGCRAPSSTPAALTHTSLGLRDALLAVQVPFVEVHLSNLFAREAARRHSHIADLAVGFICGFGADGYRMALQGPRGSAAVTEGAGPRRIAALAGVLEQEGLDALLVTHLPNIRYLTGFSGSAGLLLVRAGECRAHHRFPVRRAGARSRRPRVEVQIDPVSIWDRLGRVLGQRPVERLGVESHVLTTRDAERLSRLTRAHVVATADLVERLRAGQGPAGSRVDPGGGVAGAGRAGRGAAHGARRRPGARRGGAAGSGAPPVRGSEWHPFPTIVASGPRAALPACADHARARSSRTNCC